MCIVVGIGGPLFKCFQLSDLFSSRWVVLHRCASCLLLVLALSSQLCVWGRRCLHKPIMKQATLDRTPPPPFLLALCYHIPTSVAESTLQTSLSGACGDKWVDVRGRMLQA